MVRNKAVRPTQRSVVGRPLEYWVVVLLIAASGFTSMVGFPWPGGDFDARIALTLLCGGLWMAARVFLPGVRWNGDRRISIALLGLAMGVAVSALLSKYSTDLMFFGNTAGFSAMLAISGVIVCWGTSSLPMSSALRDGLRVVVGLALPFAVVGISQAISGSPLAVLKNGTYFGLLMLTYAPVAVGLGASGRTIVERRAWYAVALTLGTGALLSGSAAVLLGLSAQLLAAAILVRDLIPKSIRAVTTRAASVVVGFVVASAFALQVPYVLRATAGRASGLTGVATWVTRSYLWDAAADIVARRPLLGAGPDAYSLAGQRDFGTNLFALEWSASGTTALPAEAHSLPWNVLAMFGVVGAGLVLALSVFWVLRVRAVRADESNRADRLRIGLVVGTCGLVMALLFSPLSPMLGLMLPLVAGLSLAAGRPVADIADVRTVSRFAAVPLVALLLAMSAMRAGTSLDLARASRQGDPVLIAAAIDRSLRVYPSPHLRFLRLMQQGMAMGPSDVADYHASVEREKGSVGDYAPYLVDFVRVSLDEASKSGRTDLSWEQQTLDRASTLCPSLPMLSLLRLRVAVMQSDVEETRRQLTALEASGLRGELVDGYRRAAESSLAK